MLNACGNGIAIVNDVSTIVYANSILHEIFDYQPAQLLGQPFDILMPRYANYEHTSSLLQFLENEIRLPISGKKVFKCRNRLGDHIDVIITLSQINFEEQNSIIITVIEATEQHINDTSNKLLAQIIEFSHDTIFITDENTKIIWTNSISSKATGYSQSELLGQHPLFRTNDNTDPLEIKQIHTAINNKKEYIGELQLKKFNSRPYWVKLQITTLELDNGRTGFLFIEHDISSRKNVENTLRTKNHLQRTILDSAQQIIISTDVDGTIITFNDFAAHLLEWQSSEIIKQRTLDTFISAAEYQRFAEHIQTTNSLDIEENFLGLHKVTRQHKVEFTFEFQTKTQQLLTIELSANGLLNRSGDIDGYLYMGRDITQIISLEAQSKRNLETLKVTSRIAQLGGWELNLMTNNLFWSDEVYRIHELPVQSPIDVENAINYYLPEARPVLQDAINEAIEQGISWDLQLPFVTAKNNHIWVRTIGFAEFENNQAIRLKGTFQNITAIKNAENRAKEASKAKSQFLANMSHEIRTPINGIIGANELMQNTVLSKQQLSYAQAIQRSGESLLSLINDILDFSKIEAGKLKLHPQVISINTFMQSIQNEMQSQVDAKELTLDIQPLPAVKLCSDPFRLRQILLNLCINAVKFTEKGGITITCSSVDERYLRFTITDTGIGIPIDKVSELFQEFTQLDASTTRNAGGTGLGLTISKQLVKLLGGQIGFNNEYKHGAEFWFTVDTQLSLSHTAPIHRDIRTIVLVGKQDSMQQLRPQFDASLYDVQIINNANKCITFLQDNISKLDIEFIFIAHDLPGITGVDLLQAIRAQAMFDDIYIFLYNSHLEDQELTNLRHIGLIGCVNGLAEQTSLNHVLEKCQNPTINPKNLPFYTFQNINQDDTRVLLVEDNDINQAIAKNMLKNLDMRVEVAHNGMEALDILEHSSERFHAILMDC